MVGAFMHNILNPPTQPGPPYVHTLDYTTRPPSQPRRWFNGVLGRVGSWLVEHGHATAGRRLWRACGLMAGHRRARGR
jgi:hypothetical protein